ncbi:MAG: Mycothiol acetyltransferase [Planctomycetota bacterium]
MLASRHGRYAFGVSLLDRTGLFGHAPDWGDPFQPAVAQRAEALRRLAGPEPSALRRLIRDARAHPDFFDHAWCVADPDGVIAATALLAPQPGNTLHALLTRGATDAAIPALGRLLATALDSARGRGRAMAQALVEPARGRELRVLEAAGMRRLATLGYYERALPRRGRVASSWPEGASITACDVHAEHARDELASLLQATYEATLDCPALAGMRTPAETLEGHLATHAVDPDLWTMVRLGGRAAAISMCAPLPGTDAAELVYFGVAAWARGRGIGPALLQHSIGRLEHRGMRSLHLACDEANAPALHLYHNAGFHRTMRRVAYVHALR